MTSPQRVGGLGNPIFEIVFTFDYILQYIPYDRGGRFPFDVGGPNSFANDGAMIYYLMTLGEGDRAGGTGIETTSAVAMSLDMLSSAAKGLLPKVALGATTGGVLLGLSNIIKIYYDINTSSHKSLGDSFRLGYNILWTSCDARVPFSGIVPQVMDSYGTFEYHYHQFDVLEHTGYWVYFNIYTSKWRSIRIK